MRRVRKRKEKRKKKGGVCLEWMDISSGNGKCVKKKARGNQKQ